MMRLKPRELVLLFGHRKIMNKALTYSIVLAIVQALACTWLMLGYLPDHESGFELLYQQVTISSISSSVFEVTVCYWLLHLALYRYRNGIVPLMAATALLLTTAMLAINIFTPDTNTGYFTWTVVSVFLVVLAYFTLKALMLRVEVPGVDPGEADTIYMGFKRPRLWQEWLSTIAPLSLNYGGVAYCWDGKVARFKPTVNGWRWTVSYGIPKHYTWIPEGPVTDEFEHGQLKSEWTAFSWLGGNCIDMVNSSREQRGLTRLSRFPGIAITQLRSQWKRNYTK